MYRLDSNVKITVPVDFNVEPESSFIDRIAHDTVNNRCYVTMHNSTYEYENVPVWAFEALWSADSVGHAYQDFRVDYGPANFMGQNIEFEVRGMNVNPDDEIPLRAIDGEKSNVVDFPENQTEETDYLTVPGLDLSSLIPTSEELAKSDARRAREVSIHCAALSTGDTSYTSDSLIQRAKRFEQYITEGK